MCVLCFFNNIIGTNLNLSEEERMKSSPGYLNIELLSDLYYSCIFNCYVLLLIVLITCSFLICFNDRVVQLHLIKNDFEKH